MGKDFDHTRTLTKTEAKYYFINLPNKLSLPSNFSMHIGSEILQVKIDARNRMYVKGLYRKAGLRFGQKVRITLKSGKYTFTVL